MRRKILASGLFLVLLLVAVAIPVFSENTADDGLCPHHAAHTEDCGYQEGVAGSCQFDCTECASQTDQAQETAQPSLQERIDTLPDTEALASMGDEEQQAVTSEIEAILAEIEALSEEDQGQLDRTRLDALLESGEDVETAADTTYMNRKHTPNGEGWDKYTVTSVSPQNVTFNLFDYWVDSETAVDNNSSYSGRTSAAAHWARSAFLGEESINRDGDNIRPFIFAGIDRYKGWTFGPNYIYKENGLSDVGGVEGYYSFGEYTAKAKGGYNAYVGPSTRSINNTAYQGIVQRTLQNSYPVLNVSAEDVQQSFADQPLRAPWTEGNPDKYKFPEGTIVPKTLDNSNASLSYLFNTNDIDSTDTKVKGKRAYTDVKGLLQYDDSDGTYYYKSSENFAEFDGKKNFTLYNKPALLFGKTNGQFFPFNTAGDFFESSTGDLENKKNSGGNIDARETSSFINHYFGLTMEVDFYQPDGGQVEVTQEDGSVEKEAMEFDFSGDDDVWIFIDGVLVADLGGIHDAYGFTINFADGGVRFTQSLNQKFNTSIRQMFLEAIKASEDRNAAGEQYITTTQGDEITETTLDQYFRKTTGEAGTFRSGTEHTLQLYYLERGNQESNLSLSYNLVPPIADEVVKVDQDNTPMEGVEFELYKADANYNYSSTDLITSFKTDDNGVWQMLDEYKAAYDFGEIYDRNNNDRFYVIREVKAPDGYRKVQDVHLEYQPEFNILEVTNPWDTGAVGNFNAKIYQKGKLVYANPDGTSPEGEVSENKLKKGIVLAVPMTLISDKNGGQTNYANWRPIYGANLEGFAIAEVEDGDTGEYNEVKMRKSIIKAALYQVHASQTSSDYQSWHLSWSEEEQRYQGTLNDLPGTPDRYYRKAEDTSADLAMSYYFVEPGAFDTLGEDASEEDKLRHLNDLVTARLDGVQSTDANYLEKLDDAIEAVANEINSKGQFAQVDVDRFTRIYGSHIYIPNILNTLSVVKMNEDGSQRLPGAEFALYEDAKCEGTPIATGTTDSNGAIVFSATEENQTGHVKIKLAANPGASTDPNDKNLQPRYYLKEIKPPQGYAVNETITPIYITDAGVYANAGDLYDNVSIYSGLGRLVGTMSRYATDDGINITLRDLIIKAGSNGYVFGENNTPLVGGELKVHYHLNDDAVGDYSTHEGVYPVVVTEKGMAHGEVRQNMDAHKDPNDDYNRTNAKKIDLEDKELSNLFTGNTTVVVKDAMLDAFEIRGQKTLKGGDSTTPYSFKFKLTPADDATKAAIKDGSLVIPKDFSKESDSYIKEITFGKDVKNPLAFSWGTFELTAQNAGQTYTFTAEEVLPTGVSESNPSSAIMTYDTHKVGITVKVSEVTNGHVTATVTYNNEGGTESDKAIIDKAAFTNTPIEPAKADFSFTKIDGKDSSPLGGARFALYQLTCTDTGHSDEYHAKQLIQTDQEGNITDKSQETCWTVVKIDNKNYVGSGSDGTVTFTGLSTGLPGAYETYRLVEIKAPGGYTLPSGQWQVVYDGTRFAVSGSVGNPPAFKEDKQNNNAYSVANYQPGQLPVTGGQNLKMALMIGAALMALGALGFVAWKANQKPENSAQS